MTAPDFCSSAPPWVLAYFGDFGSLADMPTVRQACSGARCECVLLDGSRMQTFDGLFNEFAAHWRFPDYFGRNFNALEDCLTDLAWIEANCYVVSVQDADRVLSAEKEADLVALLQLLHRVADYWNTAIDLGEPWDRAPVPFHVVLQISLPQRPSMERILRQAKDVVPLYSAEGD